MSQLRPGFYTPAGGMSCSSQPFIGRIFFLLTRQALILLFKEGRVILVPAFEMVQLYLSRIRERKLKIYTSRVVLFKNDHI